jgi:hypothetical protein
MDFPFDTWILGFMDSLLVCSHIDFSWMFDFRVGMLDMSNPLSILDRFHLRSDMRRHVEFYMLWLGQVSFPLPNMDLAGEVYWLDTILDSRDDYLRLHKLWMQMWRMNFR